MKFFLKSKYFQNQHRKHENKNNNKRYYSYHKNKKNKKFKRYQIYISEKSYLLNKDILRKKDKKLIEINSIIKIIIFFDFILIYLFLYYLLHKKNLQNAKVQNKINNNNFTSIFKRYNKIKKVIYTVNLGNYDKIKPIPKLEGWDYINIIDWELSEEEKKNSNWTFVMIPNYVNNMNISTVKKQRFIKLHPHLFFKEKELSVYIDSKIKLIGDLNDLVIRILSPNYNIIMQEHRTRNSVFDEFNQVLQLKLEKKSMIEKIKTRYKAEGFKDNFGFGESSFILRRHNEQDCIKIMEMWWNEIKLYSHRDQLSFNYVLWKENKKIKFISRDFFLKFFEKGGHNKDKAM